MNNKNDSYNINYDIITMFHHLKNITNKNISDSYSSSCFDKNKLIKYCRRITKIFCTKYKGNINIYINDCLINCFKSIIIKNNTSNIHLLLPYDFIILYENHIESQLNIDRILKEAEIQNLNEFIDYLNHEILSCRIKLRPTLIKLLKSLIHVSFTDIIPPPSVQDIHNISHLSEETIRIYYSYKLIAKNIITHKIVINPWLSNHEIYISTISKFNHSENLKIINKHCINSTEYCLFKIASDTILEIEYLNDLVTEIIINYNIDQLNKYEKDSFIGNFLLQPPFRKPQIIFKRENYKSFYEINRVESIIINEYLNYNVDMNLNFDELLSNINNKVGLNKYEILKIINKAIKSQYLIYLIFIKFIGINCNYFIIVENSEKIVNIISRFLLQCPFSIHFKGTKTSIFYISLNYKQIHEVLNKIDDISRIDTNGTVKYNTINALNIDI